MNRLVLATFFAVLQSALPMASGAGIIEDKSSITFTGKQMGAPVEGSFRHFDADIVFKPGDLPHSHARIEVDLNSIDLASEESESEIKGKKWFNVANFPKAVFESTRFKTLGGDHYEVQGLLSIKGIDREVTVPMQFHAGPGLQVAEGSLLLQRLDFKVGEGIWADPDSVALEVRARYKMTLKP